MRTPRPLRPRRPRRRTSKSQCSRPGATSPSPKSFPWRGSALPRLPLHSNRSNIKNRSNTNVNNSNVIANPLGSRVRQTNLVTAVPPSRSATPSWRRSTSATSGASRSGGSSSSRPTTPPRPPVLRPQCLWRRRPRPNRTSSSLLSHKPPC